MVKRGLLFILLIGGVGLLFPATIVQGERAMQITSAAFPDGGKIPQKYVMPGAGGQNISLPLSWSDVPAGTQSFALSMVDPHPVARNWVHWLVINLPADVRSLPEGASEKNMPTGARELNNSWGKPGYGGPQPPKGTGDHPYVVTIYALSVPKLDLKPNVDLGTFTQALEGKVLGQASVTGYYGR
jgi:Raf kinase inhibitor-like YbhB/YbcL family protein